MMQPGYDKTREMLIQAGPFKRRARRCLGEERDERDERSSEKLRDTVRGVGWDVPAHKRRRPLW